MAEIISVVFGLKIPPRVLMDTSDKISKKNKKIQHPQMPTSQARQSHVISRGLSRYEKRGNHNEPKPFVVAPLCLGYLSYLVALNSDRFA
jgi:hypothetical protein